MDGPKHPEGTRARELCAFCSDEVKCHKSIRLGGKHLAQPRTSRAEISTRLARPGASRHVATHVCELQGEGRTLPKAALGKKINLSFAKKGFCIAKEESAEESS